jgi:membrane protease YdiL (CAAX protease family)
MRAFQPRPVLLLLLFIGAAHIVIGVGPRFVPMTHTFDRWEPAVCKVIGAALMFGLTWWFIRRDALSRTMLDVSLTARNIGILFGWTLVAALIILIWLLLVRGLLPFHFEPGTLTAAGFALSLVVYLFGSIIEELAFRGYPFLRLRSSYGVVAAVVTVSLAFGLFHFPGMYGLALLKIIAITGLCSVIFCLGFLRHGTLWAAIGLHAGMNITMHSIFGAGDPNRASLMRIAYDGPPPTWDIWFWSFMLAGSAAAIIIALARYRPVERAEHHLTGAGG